MTFSGLLILCRIATVLAAAALTGLMLGPFQGLEARLGFTDLQAHALAFFALTLLMFLVAPRWRRGDLAIAVLSFGVLVEMAQGLTGRSMSLADLAADALGVATALAPGLIEQFRRAVRMRPEQPVFSTGPTDRRRRRSADAPSPASVGALGQHDGGDGRRHDAHIDAQGSPTGI